MHPRAIQLLVTMRPATDVTAFVSADLAVFVALWRMIAMILPAAMPSCLLHRKAFRRGAEGRGRENSGRPQLAADASAGVEWPHVVSDYGKARGASNIGGLSHRVRPRTNSESAPSQAGASGGESSTSSPDTSAVASSTIGVPAIIRASEGGELGVNRLSGASRFRGAHFWSHPALASRLSLSSRQARTRTATKLHRPCR